MAFKQVDKSSAESAKLQIRKTLLERLSLFAPHTKLPTELELCRQFGVSRMTVNKVMSELVEEGYIYRVRKRGSFSLPQRTRETISFLLPYAEFIRDSCTQNVLHTMSLLSGVAEEVHRSNLRLEMIAVSPTNRADDLDFTKLQHLDSSSKVIISSFWYHHTFDFFVERKVRVAYLDAQGTFSEIPTGEWFIFEESCQQSVYDAMSFLHGLGCCRIALLTSATKPLPDRRKPLQSGYEQARNGLGQDYSLVLEYPMQDHDRVFEQFLLDYERARFDSLIFDPNLILTPLNPQNALRLRDLAGQVKLVATEPNLLLPLLAGQGVKVLRLPYEEIGRQMVRILSGREFSAGRQVWRFSLEEVDFIAEKAEPRITHG